MDFGVGPPPGPVPLGALLPSAVVVGLNGGFLAAALFVLARWSERFPTLSRRGPIWLLGPSVLFVGDLTWLVTTFLTRSGRIPDSQYHVCASVAFGVTATGAALCTTAPLWVPQAVATAPRDESDAVLGSRASRPVSAVRFEPVPAPRLLPWGMDSYPRARRRGSRRPVRVGQRVDDTAARTPSRRTHAACLLALAELAALARDARDLGHGRRRGRPPPPRAAPRCAQASAGGGAGPA
ncbi:hypothetical protein CAUPRSCDRAFT_11769 [Caulochytrium protostelioides]|uniref:Uncharacterized protein n=1 Tax=Caulochytrium protostelioides TaxID=1555241 RepID=A0A4P9WTG4_9FUNG|nr:hypothetical protein CAUPRSCDRAFT_11769 [Caulochytrium protostelioides]